MCLHVSESQVGFILSNLELQVNKQIESRYSKAHTNGPFMCR